MKEWFKKNMPALYDFITGFIQALNNKKEGHSLKKLLAVGFFWLTAICVLRYTDTDNVGTVMGLLISMITALVVTNSVSAYKERKLDKEEPPKDDEPK